MDNREKLHGLLKKAELFSGLTEASLKIVEEKMKLVAFKPDQII